MTGKYNISLLLYISQLLRNIIIRITNTCRYIKEKLSFPVVFLFYHHTIAPLLMPDMWDLSPLQTILCDTSQASILEWIAISYYRGSSQPRDQT